MSYRCKVTGRSVPAGVKRRVITTYRDDKHPYRYKANVGWAFLKGKRKKVRVDDPGGRGKQIDHETPVCEEIWDRYQNGESYDSIIGKIKR